MRFRVYIDTSVIGGCLDEEFAQESRALLEMAGKGDIVLLISDLMVEELTRAPQKVKEILTGLPVDGIEEIERSMETYRLHQAYLDAGVVSPQSSNDAHHVALATVFRADIIVSWNFKHIVHWEKIRRFNAVNLSEGYAMIDIRSPKEVV